MKTIVKPKMMMQTSYMYNRWYTFFIRHLTRLIYFEHRQADTDTGWMIVTIFNDSLEYTREAVAEATKLADADLAAYDGEPV